MTASKKYDPEAIQKEVLRFKNTVYPELCKGFSLHIKNKFPVENLETNKLWAIVNQEEVTFQLLAKGLQQYIHSFEKKPQKEHYLIAQLNILTERLGTSESELNLIFEKINLSALKKGGTIEEYVDEESGEVLSHVIAPNGVPVISTSATNFYYAVFEIATYKITRFIATYVEALNSKTYPAIKNQTIEPTLKETKQQVVNEQKKISAAKQIPFSFRIKIESARKRNEWIKELYSKLIEREYILVPDGRLLTFRTIFSGDIPKEKITWNKTNHLLCEFLNLLSPNLESRCVDSRFSIASKCFTNSSGQQLTSEKIRNHKVKSANQNSKKELTILFSKLPATNL